MKEIYTLNSTRKKKDKDIAPSNKNYQSRDIGYTQDSYKKKQINF